MVPNPLTKIRFPTRRPDGSFDVIVRLCGVHEGYVEVASWIANWSEQNGTWIRSWDAGGETTAETLLLLQDCGTSPSIEKLGDGEASVQFRVRADSKMWKDWIVRFVENFVSAYPGSSLSRFESDPSGR